MFTWRDTPIRAVFFDAVGTLIFPEPGASTVYAQAASRRGIALDADTVRRRLWTAFRVEEEVDRGSGWITSEERERARWRRIVAYSLPELNDTEDCFQELFDHFAQPASWTVNADAEALFATLRQRDVALGMASNYDARLRSVIDGHAALSPLRERIVVSAAVGYRKPARQFFDEVIRIAGCEPHEILFVGDDVENDYLGAKAAGLTPVLLDPQKRSAISSTQIESQILSLAELI